MFSAGCASAPSPSPSLETARVAVGEATRYEAPKYAATELAIAESKLQRAQLEGEHGERVLARRLAEQATVDARYAQSRALAEREQRAAVETHQTAETLRSRP
jgi:hypothetical protein